MSTAREPQPLRANDPTRVGRYPVLGRLGTGGMGVVYLADGPAGKIALKVVRSDLGEDPQFRARFRREVQACFRVKSASTAQLVDFDTDADQPWMATEYVEGVPLDDLVMASHPLDPDQLRDLAVGLAEALAAIHAAGLVHRDLKPGNVLVTERGPKVIDFGIAAAEDAKRLTAAHLMVGTLGWLAPEQLTSGHVGPENDIFALGLVLGFAATGRPPFGTGKDASIIFRNANQPPDVDPTQLPPALREVYERCTQRDPAQRPTARQLLELLSESGISPREGQQTRPSDATTLLPPPTAPTPTRKRNRRWLIGGAAALAAGVLAAGIVLVVQDETSSGGTNSNSAGGNPTLPRPGTYRGQTAQHFGITFSVTANHQIDDINFIEKVTCTVSGATQTLFAGLPTTSGPLGANGVFAVNVVLPEQTFRMIGGYAQGKFTGGFRHMYNSDLQGHPTLATPPAQTCDSNQITFMATRGSAKR